MIPGWLSEHWLKAAGAGVGLLTALTTAGYSTWTWHDTRYAKQADTILIEMRLEQKILSDRAARLQDRIWKIEDRYGDDMDKAPDTVKEEYRQLQQDLEAAIQELNSLQQEYRSMQRQMPNSYYDRERSSPKSGK